MSKVIVIKLVSAGHPVGPFNIYDQTNNILAENVPLEDMIRGITLTVEDNVVAIVIESLGDCKFKKIQQLETITQSEFMNSPFVRTYKACLWKHLTDTIHYNYYYGVIEPYIIEYPFSYSYQDQILQNVQDYTKVYEYLKSTEGVFDDTRKVQPNDKWFNKAILYNDQQSSGVLVLAPKPLHNLKEYNSYPKYADDHKVILWSKSDNFYQYNTFWNIVKDPLVPLFKASCESMSIDKEVNQDNMDYALKSFKKAPLRAKDLKIRHILDNSSTTHLVSQFLIAPSQNSYR